jgi:hypothetical protein
LDLEGAIAPVDKVSARKMVKDMMPIAKKGGSRDLMTPLKE